MAFFTLKINLENEFSKPFQLNIIILPSINYITLGSISRNIYIYLGPFIQNILKFFLGERKI